MIFRFVLPLLICLLPAAGAQSIRSLPHPGNRWDLLTSLCFFSESAPGFSGGGAGFGTTFRQGGEGPWGLHLGGGYLYREKQGVWEPGGFGELQVQWKPWVFSPFGAGVHGGLRWTRGWIPGIRVGAEADFRGAGRSYLFLRMEGGLDPDLTPTAFLGAGIKISYPQVESFPGPRPEVLLPSEPFSPDGDGQSDELKIELHTLRPDKIRRWQVEITDPGGRLVKTWGGDGPPPRSLVWDGMEEGRVILDSASDYPVDFSVEDAMERRESVRKILLTDILIITEGTKSRIRVPYIEFNPNTPVLASVDPQKKEANQEILRRLARFFSKYPGYRFRIVGHGNLINWQSQAQSDQENRSILKPLSLRRAESVRDALEDLGIARDRMEVEGRGGDEPLVPFGDVQENWRNRRVEFILLK